MFDVSSICLRHHSFLLNGTSITADDYYEELDTRRVREREKREAIEARKFLARLDKSFRCYYTTTVVLMTVAQQMVSNIQELGLEALRDSPYSSDLMPRYLSFF